MFQGKTLIVALVALALGFAGGFILRPIIIPPANTPVIVGRAQTPVSATPARGIQYFEASTEDARRVIAGCRDGSIRSEECVNAQQAVTEADGRDRFKKFMGH